MPEPADRQKGILGILVAALLLLLPSSIAVQWGLRTSEPSPGASSSPEAATSEGKDQKEPAAATPAGAGCALLKQSHGLRLLSAYYGLDVCRLAPGTERPCGAEPVLPAEKLPFPGSLDRLLALVPDKSQGLDGVIESIARAYESAGYTLVRKQLPWRPQEDPEEGSGSESVPGVLLFHEETDAGVRSRLVYLIEETPTEGIRERAFAAALADWELTARTLTFAPGHGPAREQRILGPMFSGSAARLGRLLAAAQQRCADTSPVRILSGSATSSTSPHRLHSAYNSAFGIKAPPRLTYGTTVRTDDEMKEAMWSYLTQQLLVAGDRIALIVESSTSYGQQTAESLRDYTPPETTQAATQAATQTATQAVTLRPRLQDLHRFTPFDRTTLLVLPANLAPLQDEWSKRGRGKSPPPTETEQQKILGRLHHSALRRGALPVLDRSTLTTRDLALSSLLSAVCQQGIQFVGLMLTGADDKRFLAQRLNLECPDVRVFTLESEIDYLHPEDYSFMRGMLVASTYPLHSRNQQWSSVYGRRNPQILQFASQPDQGLYNATLLLLQDSNRHDLEGLLQEYAPPAFGPEPRRCGEAPCLRPSVWISAVGRQGLIPLLAYSQFSSSTPVRAVAPLPEDKQVRPVSRPYDLGTVHILLFLLTAAALVHCFAYFQSRYGQVPWKLRSGVLPRYLDFLGSSEPRPRLYILTLLLPLLLSIAYVTLVLALRFRPGNLGSLGALPRKLFTDASFAEDLLYTVSALLGTSGILYTMLDVVLRQPRRLRGAWSQLSQRFARSRVLPPGLAVLAVGALAWLAYSLYGRLEKNHAAILFLRRSSQTAYELSPMIPWLLLCGVGYLWSLYSLRTLHRLSDQPVGALEQILATGRDEDADRPEPPSTSQKTRPPAPAQPLERLLSKTPLRVWLLSGFGTLLATLPVLRRLGTLDHYALTLCFRGLFFGAILLVVVSLVRVFRVWRRLRRLLDRAARHALHDALVHLPPAFAHPLGSLVLTALSPQEEQLLTEQLCQAVHDACAQADGAQRSRFAPLLQHTDRLRLRADTQGPEPAPDSPDAHDPQRLNESIRAIRDFLIAEGAWLPSGRPPLTEPSAAPDPAAGRFRRSLEELLAGRLVALLYHVLAHLRSTMLFITLSLILLLLALNSYPFQPIQWLTILIWLLFLLAMSLSGYVLLQMNRDAVLGQLAHGPEGRPGWDAGLTKQLAIYILAPLLSLIATQFPALSWFPKLLQNLK
ncbi:MAG: hypothetical protein U1A78_24590 [Polyangia bacterium]